MTRYMRHQLLRDSDVMSMRWGLELRVPMVDRDLFEALGKIPSAQRLQPGKQLLVDAIPELPDHILNQPKRGFTFPFTRWVEGEWQEMLESSGQNSPVPLTSWYQKWALFVFQQWKVELGVDEVTKKD
jgi:asparagine synthase (glutamine-hydrolysing)